jgi:hypothetical protein
MVRRWPVPANGYRAGLGQVPADVFGGVVGAPGLAPFSASNVLVLLCQNFWMSVRAATGATQQGQRDSITTRAALNLRRMVAIEFGTCLSGRNGGAPRAIGFGKLNFFEQPGGTSS